MEGLMRIEWTRESHIKALLQAAGWPSALLWHKQRGHVPLLSAEGTPPHIFTEQGSLAPCRWSLVPFFGICLARDNPLFSATCYSEHERLNIDNLLDTTGKRWNQITARSQVKIGNRTFNTQHDSQCIVWVKHQSLTFEKLEPVNVWHLCLKIYFIT